jgi:hypothetical protein
MPDVLRERLEAATAGLLFSTESDRPFVFVRLAACEPVSSLTPERVAALAGEPGAKAREWPLERFLARHITRVDALDERSRALIPRYEALETALRGALGRVRVFRVGEVEIRVLALGNDPASGELVGLETVAVET